MASQNQSENKKLAVGENILKNHDFRNGIKSWTTVACQASVDPTDNSVVLTERTKKRSSIRQNITDGILPGYIYAVSACIKVSENSFSNVIATVKLEHQATPDTCIHPGWILASNQWWSTMECTFTLTIKPKEIMFFLEGPPPGVDLHIKSVVIRCTGAASYKVDGNLIQNSDFSQGLFAWTPTVPGPQLFLLASYKDHPHESAGSGGAPDGRYVIVTNRVKDEEGLQQDITGRVCPGFTYQVATCVGVLGLNEPTHKVFVKATLQLLYQDSPAEIIYVGDPDGTAVGKDEYKLLKGEFKILTAPCRVLFKIYGPPPGLPLLGRSAEIKCTLDSNPSSSQVKDKIYSGERSTTRQRLW